MSTGFDDSDELLAAYLAESGEADLGEEVPPRVWEDGREVGEWTVTGFLARGGSAEVYCAMHRRLGTWAALKVLWRNGAGPRERFDRESRFLMGNPGPSFPAFYGAGVEDGRPWVAMELLDEFPLPSSDREVARYLLDVGEGVATLHARGWLHRDIKPGNILRREDGHAVLADFGLLKAVGTGDAPSDAAAERESPSVVDGREAGVGTPGHSAPEQFVGGGATPTADVYALGMLAEECFGGHPPRAWEKIIRRATAALPRQRYPDVEPMLRAIRRRHWGRYWALALPAALGVALAAAVFSREAREVPQEPPSSAAEPELGTTEGAEPEREETPEPAAPAEPMRVEAEEERPTAARTEPEVGESESEQMPTARAETEPARPEPEREGKPAAASEPMRGDAEEEPQSAPKPAERTEPVVREPEAGREPAPPASSTVREAERAREAAVRRASEGAGRKVVAGILRDMVVIKGADKFPNPLRKALGVASGQVLIGRHEVTQAQWNALMESNPSRFAGADRPVDGVNIGDCLEFIGRLNRMPDVREAGLRFRLPTLDEWKMAAGDRLAQQHDYWHKFAMAATNPGNDDFPDEPPETGWFAENSGGETHPVGQTAPDEHGLYDCYGNVAELVFAVSEMKSLSDSFSVTGLRCMGGNYLQRQNEFDTPILLGVLGREIETLPEEWQSIVRATGIPVRLPEAMVASHPDRAAKFSGLGVGMRLCADKVAERER